MIKGQSPPPKMERHQNVTICSMANRQHFLKMSFKSVHNFLSCFVLSQKDSLTVT